MLSIEPPDVREVQRRRVLRVGVLAGRKLRDVSWFSGKVDPYVKI